MTEYKRLTDREYRYTYCANCELKNCEYCDEELYLEAEAIARLAELEDKIENHTLIDIETVAKLMVAIMDDCLCNFHDIAEYMYEHCGDWCDKSCDSVSATGDYTPCWVKYLTAKLEELKRGQK